MREQTHRPFFVEFLRQIKVDFAPPKTVKIGVEVEFVGQVGFLEFNVYLPRHGLVAIHHRPRAFAHVNGLYPSARREIQAKNGVQAANRRNIFGVGLDVITAQTQQLNLLGPRYGIGVADRNAGVGFKTFGQIAASRLGEGSGGNNFGLNGVEAVNDRGPAAHFYLLQ